MMIEEDLSQKSDVSSVQREYPLLIPYQVDFNTTTTGKHISLTKRHCRWRFGFAHLPSICAGKDSVNCRGMEMEIHLVWSVASGKYNIYVNNILIHNSITTTAGVIQKFDHTFSLPEGIFPGNHVIHITAWATETTCHIGKGQSQFDLKLDGQSFTEFLRIFELGGQRMRSIYGENIDHMLERGRIASLDEVVMKKRNKANEHVTRNIGATSTAINGSSKKDIDSIVGDRPRYQAKRTISQKYLYQDGNGITIQRPLVAKTDEEEKRLLEQARLNSLRDLRDNRTIRTTSTKPPFTNTNHLQHRTVQQATKLKRPTHLTPVEEHKDLIDMESPVTPECEILRSPSSLTMDTNLKNADDESIDYYSHLDPKQMWNTQNLPFRPQQPPQYQDSLAGDLIQPSISTSTYHQQQPTTASMPNTANMSVNMAFVMPPTVGHRMNTSSAQSQGMMSQSMRSVLKPGEIPFNAPPPPSWETLDAEFGSHPNVPSVPPSAFTSPPPPQQFQYFNQQR